MTVQLRYPFCFFQDFQIVRSGTCLSFNWLAATKATGLKTTMMLAAPQSDNLPLGFEKMLR